MFVEAVFNVWFLLSAVCRKLFLRILTVHANSRATSCTSARALRNKMKNDRADGHCYTFSLI